MVWMVWGVVKMEGWCLDCKGDSRHKGMVGVCDWNVYGRISEMEVFMNGMDGLVKGTAPRDQFLLWNELCMNECEWMSIYRWNGGNMTARNLVEIWNGDGRCMWLFVHVIKGWKCMCFDRNERECTVLVDFWWLWGGNLGGNACGLKLCEWLRWMCMSACEILEIWWVMHGKGWRLNVCWCDWMIKVHVGGNACAMADCGAMIMSCGWNDEMDGSACGLGACD